MTSNFSNTRLSSVPTEAELRRRVKSGQDAISLLSSSISRATTPSKLAELVVGALLFLTPMFWLMISFTLSTNP